MAFGGGGGFGGFGSNQQQSTFGGSGGGFGSTANTGGFGAAANNTSTPFGQSNTGGSLFGGGSTGTTGAFGGGGFGAGNTANTTSTFGSKPFGSTATGTTGLFGGGGSTSGSTFGGFGASATPATSTGFGGAASGGGLFGGNKPAGGFGATSSGTGTGGLFGGGSTTAGSTFGGSGTTGGFGGTASGFGAGSSAAPQANNGTASVPFSAFEEKDASGRQQFQTITFQAPYQNYSLEELRLVDYNQGRRFGNQNGQAGAFGQSTGFGGFGGATTTPSTGFGATNTSTGGGLFGGNTASSTPFGQQNNTTSTFGGNTTATGGGLFGQKPAGGLFGGSTSTAQPATGGGLFGGASNTNTGGGFGASSGTTGFGGSTATGGGLFGGQQNQAKPAFGGFGASTTSTQPTSTPFGGGSTGAFGQNQTNTTGGGLFGGSQNQASNTSAFGGQQPAATGGGLFGGGGGATGNTGGGLFGGSTQTQTQNQPSGGLFGTGQQNQAQNTGGLFGNKPATGGLFGNTAQTNTSTGGGLFGGQTNQTQQQPSGGLFGGGQQTGAQNTGGLFGAKPATSGGLFGTSTAQGTGSTGTSLFGNTGTANQANQGTSLFGQSQQKPGGLFGGSTSNTGTSLFGGQQQNNTSNLGGSLFGGQSQQQQTQQPMNNSLFGNSGTSSLLQTSMNTNPYGNDQMFTNIATPQASPGPLATPLSSSQKNRKSAILPQHKLNPSASTRLLTPQNNKAGGYGFTYSTYGTPNSASSGSSPNFSASLFGNSSLTRSVGRSLSTSNLRNAYTPDTSILAPGAFSTNGRSFATGNLKKLNINRSINTRVPLFDQPEKKRVSFAGPSIGTDSSETNGDLSPKGNELVLRADPESPEPAAPSPDHHADGVNGASEQPEMSQVNGTGLGPVQEEPLQQRTSSSLNKQGGSVVDPTPGHYYSRPSMDALRKMSRTELSHVQDFVVGRDKIGEVQFNPGKAVDLTGVDLNKLFGDIVQLTIRNATVYGATTTVPKPARGSGLNVPSRITLGNSWPRNKAGKKDQKHLERLRRVHGTVFEKYRADTGEWIFTVPHFSSYGLDYEGDLYDDDDESSELSEAPDTPAMFRSTGTPLEDDSPSPTQSSPDDTFDFKNRSLNRKRASVPGGFGNEVAYEEDEAEETMNTSDGQSFLGERSVGSLDGQHDADYTEESESESVEDQDMAGPVSAPAHTTEQPSAISNMPKSILKPSHVLLPGLGTPSKGPLVFDDDWANQLQRTISPKKQDRHALRETQGDLLQEQDGTAIKFGQSTSNSIFTRAGLMESLFGEADSGMGAMPKRAVTGIEYPYAKRPKTSNDLDELNEKERNFHSCNKPHFGESGILVYASKGSRSLEGGLYRTVEEPIVLANGDIRFTKLPTFADAAPETLIKQKNQTEIRLQDGVPYARLRTGDAPLDFADLANAVSIDTPAGVQERNAWQLLSILFDEADEVPSEMTRELFEQQKTRYRKDKLSEFWESLVSQDAEKHAQQADTPEEKAIAYLSGHDVPGACHTLLTNLDLRLATVVSQIGGVQEMREDMKAQILEWHRLDVLSEMELSVRALYELVAGNCAESKGKPIANPEDKAKTFCIAQEFGLDWRRAFGLRLWYGIVAEEDIELAVAQFGDALRDDKEKVNPTPWFVDAGVDMGWNDPKPEQREDLLWGILELYASSRMDIPTNLEDVLAPENVSGHPLNARLSFQLFQLFKSRDEDPEEDGDRKVGMPTLREAEGFNHSMMSTASSAEHQSEAPLVDLGDKITITYASSLHTPEHWITALFVYAHLSSPAMREHCIRSLLAQYSHTFAVNDADSTYKQLVEELLIPKEWIHAAAALQAKVDGDNLRQTVHLIKAGELDEAHEVLCRSVGPDSIISRDYDGLRELLEEFVPANATSPKEPVEGWSLGGQIYFDYIHLLDLTNNQSSYRVDEELNKDINNLLSKLQRSLEIIARDRMDTCGLEERVALTEIAGVVAARVAKNKHTERSRVLKLPLTEDLWLRHSSDLSLSYYRAVMATGK